jgi:multiple sugar transport system substrate-binding protein
VGRKSLWKSRCAYSTSTADAWTLEEFNDALAKLQALDDVEYAIDLKMNYGAGEWFTYAFSPIIQSWGGDLIDRETYLTAEDILNGPEAVAAMTWVQDLFEQGYTIVSPPDDYEFVNGKAALGWLGRWMTTAYDAFGDDMVVIPMPDFGASAVGMGSWAWSSARSVNVPKRPGRTSNSRCNPMKSQSPMKTARFQSFLSLEKSGFTAKAGV